MNQTDAALAAPAPRFRLDPRLHSPLWITLLLLVGHAANGILESPGQLALAVAASIATDAVLGRVSHGAWPPIASSYMTGTSVGMMLRTPEYWPFAVTAAISVMSKYVLKVNGRHIWNPSNFGVSFMLFMYPAHVAHLSVQWGNSSWSIVMVWLLGIIALTRLRLIHISLSYVTAFLILAYPRSLITGHTWLTEVAPITGPMYQLYILLMLTDPKTSVKSRPVQMAMVVTVALVEAVFRCLPTLYPGSGVVQDIAIHAPFYALFLVGPSFFVCELLTRKEVPRVQAVR